MDANFVLGLGREAIIMVLMVSGPMLFFGLVVGLIISILQAVTQIHEMTLTFIPKILAVVAALLIFLPWQINILLDFTNRLISNIPLIAK